MLNDAITYLSKNKGANMNGLGLDLKLIDTYYRFDSNRFNILSYDYNDTHIYGIKDLRTDVGLKGLQKIVDDSNWLSRFKGSGIVLMPAEYEKYHHVFDDEQNVMTKYYVTDGKDYIFMDDLREYEELKRERAKERTKEATSNLFTSPRMVDFVLKQFEKKSPAIKLLRGAINAYTGPKTRKW